MHQLHICWHDAVPADTAFRCQAYVIHQPVCYHPGGDQCIAGAPVARSVGSASSSTGITVDSIRVYNYALPRLSQAKESICADDGSCGRFLVAGWQPPAAASVPAGTIDLHGVVPSVASTRISLQSNSYYLMVRHSNVHPVASDALTVPK